MPSGIQNSTVKKIDLLEEFSMLKNEIDRVLNETEYDLLIIGIRGRSIMANVFLGRIAEHFLHTADKPLLIVP